MTRTNLPPRIPQSARALSGHASAIMTSLCGCYYEVGTDADKTSKHLPQVDVAAHTTIFSTASETELEQNFINPSRNEDISECRYVFPLYDGVSVVAFICEIGSRVIHGVVKEKAEAKKIFDNAVSRGETAGILEQGPSTDVFITTLGNIPAGERLRVRIKYVGELKHDLALEGIQFRLPVFISPRYGAGGPQGDMDSSSAGGISITVDINMPSECPIQEIRSPSHPIGLSLGRTSKQKHDSLNSSHASATLSLGTSALDKDFILEVRHKDSGKARAFVESHPTIDGQRALMTTLVPQIGKPQGEKPEIIIVADQSGSMQGGRTQTLVAALRVLLKSLPIGINFNICAFGSGHTFLWQKSHMYGEEPLTEALKFLETFSGHHGGTETLGAVQAAIESRDPNQRLSMILATDGDIWQQSALFSYLDEQLAMSKKPIRVFPLGIGNSVSSSLIEGVARAGKGFASSVGEGEKLDSKIIRMLKGAMTPDSGTYTMEVQYHKDRDEDEYELVDRVTDSLQIMMVDDSESIGGLAPSAMVVVEPHIAGDKPDSAAIVAPKLLQAPQVLPPLYPLTRTSVYLLLSPQATRATPKTVILRNDTTENRFEVAIPVEVLPEPGTTIHSLAAKCAILELEEGRGWLSHAKGAKNQLLKEVQPAEIYSDLVKKEAVRLGVEYQITGKYTSCVAVESNSALEEGEKSIERDIIIAPRPKSQELGQGLSGNNSLGSAGTTLFGDPTSSYGLAQSLSGNNSLGSAGTTLFGNPTSSYGLAQGLSGNNSLGSAGTTLFGDPTSSYRPAQAPRMQLASRADPVAAPPPAASAQSFGYSGVEKQSDRKRKVFAFSAAAPAPSAAPKNDVGADPLQRLIALQTFAGFWEFNESLLQVCSISMAEEVPAGGVDSKIFATILALQYLELKMEKEKEAWEMVAEKAVAWLQAQGIDDVGDGKAKKELEEAAQKLIGRA